MQPEQTTKSFAVRKWGKRAGLIAFLFFLGKGLIWLAIAVAGFYYALN